MFLIVYNHLKLGNMFSLPQNDLFMRPANSIGRRASFIPMEVAQWRMTSKSLYFRCMKLPG